ncbi:hypothetical protein TorRG33x02_314590 [Trema orientale]|uniref:Uncharacterized protein n=1 Tax=Trema orientale TaxID=63057 RepID=A0A2P5BNN5_TREOI|nr:hypothetical protein TorRG33x02_314590 [Trema orientale]
MAITCPISRHSSPNPSPPNLHFPSPLPPSAQSPRLESQSGNPVAPPPKNDLKSRRRNRQRKTPRRPPASWTNALIDNLASKSCPNGN